MAVLKCPDCGRDVSGSLKACPHCGRKIEKPTDLITTTISIGMFIGIILFVLVSLFSSPPETPAEKVRKQERDKPIEAFSMAQVMIEDLLKAPSTADFAPFNYDSVQRIDLTTWKVKTYVDAENSFGAKLRTWVEVTLEEDAPSQRWKCLDIRKLE